MYRRANVITVSTDFIQMAVESVYYGMLYYL